MSEIYTEDVSYSANGEIHKGYLAFDSDVDGVRPGVLVVHEWWGLNNYVRERARQIAGLGYTALAIDMYGAGRTAETPDQAGELMNAVLGDMDTGTLRLQAGYENLKAQPTVDADRVGAVGYCFGGAMVLHMARIGMPLRAVASFHGALGSFHTPQPGSVKARVLVCHGGADALIPEEDVRNFKDEMEAAGADYSFVAYEGALHGFTSREADENGRKYGLPLGYNEAADKQSWTAMRDLFEDVF